MQAWDGASSHGKPFLATLERQVPTPYPVATRLLIGAVHTRFFAFARFLSEPLLLSCTFLLYTLTVGKPEIRYERLPPSLSIAMKVNPSLLLEWERQLLLCENPLFSPLLQVKE